MKVIDEGHSFELNCLDGDIVQRLIHVKREGPGYPGNIGSYPGTTMQEVLRAELNRARYVNMQTPCAETEGVINCLQQALLLLEIRAKRVKGKLLVLSDLSILETAEICKTCGHIHCTESHEH